MSKYVDGFVLPVAEDRVEEYREMASEAGEAWIEHGALQYVECVGDDLAPDMGGMEYTPFPELVATDSDETVVFAFIVYESREHRDEVNAAVMAEMDEDEDPEMPFDVARMSYGGFDAIVELAGEQTGESVETAE